MSSPGLPTWLFSRAGRVMAYWLLIGAGLLWLFNFVFPDTAATGVASLAVLVSLVLAFGIERLLHGRGK